MSELLKEIVGDEDDSYYDDDEDYDYSSSGDEVDETITEEEIKANLTFKNHSDRRHELKHNKHAKSKILINEQDDNQVLEISQEEMEYYQQLKLYGINGPPKKEKETLNEEINFKLDVLQSSKMFFETVRTTVVTIYSGSRSYDEKFRYLRQNSYRIMREKKYADEEEMMASELTEPRLKIDILKESKSVEYVQQLMNRTDHMSCLSSDMKYLYVYGGKSRISACSDFIIYEIQTGKTSVYVNLSFASQFSNYQATRLQIPTSIGAMFENNGIIYVLSKGENHKNIHVYTIENLRDPMKVVYGTSNGYPWSHSDMLFNYRTYFTINHVCSSLVLNVYLFGGKCEDKVMDEMFILHIPIDGLCSSTKIEKPKVGDWPCARYGHSSCMIANLIFVYGGMNNKNELLNDLYMFDTTSEVWTEISVESMLPPPLYKHQSFAINNQSFFIMGGQDRQGALSSLFRFDIVDRKWSLMEVISDERNTRLSGHQCLAANNKLYIIGGNVGQESSNVVRSFNVLLNLNDPGKTLPICHYLSTKRREGYLCDIAFRVKDKSADTTSYILAHRCILKARCHYLSSLLVQSVKETMNCNNFEGTFLTDDIGVIDITDCYTNTFEKYLEYLYTGSLKLENLDEINQFLEFVKKISEDRHFPFVQNICSIDVRKDLGLTKQILNDMHKDFTTLIDDSTYSDLVVVLDQENQFEQAPPTNWQDEEFNEEEILSPLTSSSIPSSGISVHRLIMSRSSFFSRMLVTSGMMETKEKVVHLTDYSKEVMLDMLKYLYTDIIQLTSRNCLGILVYSLMFDLTDLASCCRRMVISLLDNSTVWVVHEIALLYNEKSLESECEHYIANNFATIGGSTAFLDLPDMTRIKIKQIYERKNKKMK